MFETKERRTQPDTKWRFCISVIISVENVGIFCIFCDSIYAREKETQKQQQCCWMEYRKLPFIHIHSDFVIASNLCGRMCCSEIHLIVCVCV